MYSRVCRFKTGNCRSSVFSVLAKVIKLLRTFFFCPPLSITREHRRGEVHPRVMKANETQIRQWVIVVTAETKYI